MTPKPESPTRMTMIATERTVETPTEGDAPLRMTMSLDAEPLPMRRARGTEPPAVEKVDETLA